ncbi:hypothetical protein ACI7RC_23525 [Brevibacillus sp. B_LB10_24]|uniref:hypothetical protein n=1 Tax=Brevibacillus sp. B_LB10_24 TaxID=3380645 RepID=UPI0038BB9070
MATMEAHQVHSTAVEMLLGRQVRYQKHKPGKSLLLKGIPEGFFQIDSISRFGDRIVMNDGAIVMESAPTVIQRKGRIVLFLPTGEELYFFTE